MMRTCPEVWACAALVVSAACATAPAAVVQRLDVRVVVEASGRVDVTETASVMFDAPGAVFERAVDSTWADHVAFTSASADGTPLSGTAGDVSIVVRDGRQLHVQVSSSSASSRPRALVLRYRLEGAIGLEGRRGTLTLPIAAAGHVAVGRTTVTLELPAGTNPLDGSGMAEAGWTVERQPLGLLAARETLASTDTATLMVRFEIEPGTRPEPVWQIHQVQARSLMPAFLSAGVFVMVVGAGVLWIVRFQYPKTRAVSARASAERQDVRRGLRFAGAAAIVLGFATALVARVFLDHLGPWPMALPVGILVVGVVFVGVSRRWV